MHDLSLHRSRGCSVLAMALKAVLLAVCLTWLSLIASAHRGHSHRSMSLQNVLVNPNATVNNIPFSTRVHWMRRANQALAPDPCPMAAFASVIVNHTATGPDGLGDLLCVGTNAKSKVGNPTLHGMGLDFLSPTGERWWN